MNAERHVRLFPQRAQPGGTHPRDFQLPGEEAIIRKEGDRLIIEPAKPRSLLALLATLDPIDEDIDPIDDPAPEPVDL